jgi:hypothetical protein
VPLPVLVVNDRDGVRHRGASRGTLQLPSRAWTCGLVDLWRWPEPHELTFKRSCLATIHLFSFPPSVQSTPPPPTAASAKGGITNTPLTRTQVTVHVAVKILQPLLLTPPLSLPRSRRIPLQTRGRRAHHQGEGRRLLSAIFTTFVSWGVGVAGARAVGIAGTRAVRGCTGGMESNGGAFGASSWLFLHSVCVCVFVCVCVCVCVCVIVPRRQHTIYMRRRTHARRGI